MSLADVFHHAIQWNVATILFVLIMAFNIFSLTYHIYRTYRTMVSWQWTDTTWFRSSLKKSMKHILSEHIFVLVCTVLGAGGAALYWGLVPFAFIGLVLSLIPTIHSADISGII